ncbi:MAG: hypothetical protein IJH39_06505 [Clostridia bacterium]|nr:hypothetical protein [Clostridia bacterium]
MNFKSEKGVTIKSLIIIIILLFAMIGTVIFTSKNLLEVRRLDSLETNMLVIHAKAKEYCENAKTKLGAIPTDETRQEAKKYLDEIGSKDYENLQKDIERFHVEDKEYLYLLTAESFEKMGITNINSNEKNGYYFVNYDIEGEKVEVYNSKGYTKDNNTYYSLTELQEKQ